MENMCIPSNIIQTMKNNFLITSKKQRAELNQIPDDRKSIQLNAKDYIKHVTQMKQVNQFNQMNPVKPAESDAPDKNV